MLWLTLFDCFHVQVEKILYENEIFTFRMPVIVLNETKLKGSIGMQIYGFSHNVLDISRTRNNIFVYSQQLT